MAQDKTKWAGYDDDFLDESIFPLDKKFQVSLERQRIRNFLVTIGQFGHSELKEVETE